MFIFCKACGSDCATCSADNVCDSCNEGFRVDSNACTGKDPESQSIKYLNIVTINELNV